MGNLRRIDDFLDECGRVFMLERDKLERLISHYPSIGRYREHILRDFLAEHLPKQYDVDMGFIHSEDGDEKQCDILVYDSQKYYVLFRYREFVIVQPSSVSAVIEVKKSLPRSELRKAFSNIRAAKEMNPDALGLVFSYKGCQQTTIENALMEEIAKGRVSYLPDGIYSLPSWVLRKTQKDFQLFDVPPDENCFRSFYSHLLSGLAKKDGLDCQAPIADSIDARHLVRTIPF